MARLRITARDLQHARHLGAARSASTAHRTACADRLLDTLAAAESKRLADRVVVPGHLGSVLYRNVLISGICETGVDAMRASVGCGQFVGVGMTAEAVLGLVQGHVMGFAQDVCSSQPRYPAADDGRTAQALRAGDLPARGRLGRSFHGVLSFPGRVNGAFRGLVRRL
ncbi:hypothetical protein AFM16_37495 [Streptomyces antibioticus]|uniref:Uncharacterized protein n=1 Tax=Streptomyces antibioticus TaxID=1890 RepID=A0ABX3LCJ0_STRAT|nr:hypothetical protein AFM16_37495 [Streptomyces antibioticus]